jgi:ATP-dependent DNA helicase RecG
MLSYADLDHSIIDEMPPDRKTIKTALIHQSRRGEIVERILKACQSGKQAYWVCTLIEESELLQCEAAEKTAVQLQAQLPSLKIGLLHGRMKSSDKEAMMAAFIAREYHLLVSTTVIEVGVDVVNANLMIIENPERLGLSQLHQLRGRVGRGSAESFCVLLYQPPLSEFSRERLKIMRETTDGFKIAEKDLELRGPGEFLGTKQAGLADLRIAHLVRDRDLLPHVHRAAEALLEQHPDLVAPLIHRWIAMKQEYAAV